MSFRPPPVDSNLQDVKGYLSILRNLSTSPLLHEQCCAWTLTCISNIWCTLVSKMAHVVRCLIIILMSRAYMDPIDGKKGKPSSEDRRSTLAEHLMEYGETIDSASKKKRRDLAFEVSTDQLESQRDRLLFEKEILGQFIVTYKACRSWVSWMLWKRASNDALQSVVINDKHLKSDAGCRL